MDGLIKVATALPRVEVANVTFNTQDIENLIVKAEGKGVEILCFPELALTAYTCQDLFAQQLLLDEAEQGLLKLLELSRNVQLAVVVGVPVSHRGMLFNCAAVVQQGKIFGLVPKTYLPNYHEFYEKRWFSSASALSHNESIRICGQTTVIGVEQLFHINDATFGIEICEDLWAPVPPSNNLALQGAEIVLNLSASNDLVGKTDYVRQLVKGQSARCHCAYLYAGAGFGESTQDLVFGGRAFIAENGTILAESTQFSLEPQLIISEVDVELLRSERRSNTSFSQSIAQQTAQQMPFRVAELEMVLREQASTRTYDPLPFVPQGAQLATRCHEILNIQSLGLAKRLKHTHTNHLVVGISGGLDSTLALLIAVHTFDLLGLERKGIVGITMPGFGTTDRTYNNALLLMKELGITIREIPIAAAVRQHFADINHNEEVHDVTYENSQARERTQILMDVANQVGGMVLGTGDLSELALGWATYNGDHMSMYAVNASIPKTLVKHLVRWVADNIMEAGCQDVLLDIVDTPISPELLPADQQGQITQKTEDLVGPYELHDFFLYYTLRYGFKPSKIFRLAVSAFSTSDASRNVCSYPETTIAHWLHVFFRRFFQQQFKRSCLPDAPKVGSCSLSPRGDWRMPSDASANIWLAECEHLLQSYAPMQQDVELEPSFSQVSHLEHSFVLRNTHNPKVFH